MTEAEGCDLLYRVFTARGYEIARNVPVSLEGVSFSADGWDARRRVGFEYLTHASRDHVDLSAKEREGLEALLEAGKVFVFVVDELDVGAPADLEWAAQRFLDAVEARVGRPS
ncbi:MAG: hypothetical protein KA712_12090 [Myxococcales bacterium]|nr:hypothetical protein [Myxococcales bacterium]